MEINTDELRRAATSLPQKNLPFAMQLDARDVSKKLGEAADEIDKLRGDHHVASRIHEYQKESLDIAVKALRRIAEYEPCNNVDVNTRTLKEIMNILSIVWTSLEVRGIPQDEKKEEDDNGRG